MSTLHFFVKGDSAIDFAFHQRIISTEIHVLMGVCAMGNKAIIRVAKHSTIGGLAASGQHNFRERETQNADAERTPLNEIQGAEETADLLNRVSNLLPSLQKKTLEDGTEVISKRRKDAVICLEYLITASPAHFGEWRESGNHGQDYFADSIAWLEKKHGKQNVVCTSIHLDESTPHLCAYVVPLTKDGRLSAKDFVGGRKVLADLQTDFAERVGKKHDLERGELMSNSVHREPAHIASMTKERRRLEKQVKALESEVERLTKQVASGESALVDAQKKAQETKLRLLAFSVKTSDKAEEKIAQVTQENEKLKGELAVEREKYFVDMAKRYESHKAQGGSVFDFEPNREPPSFVKEAAPESLKEKFARRTEEKRQRELLNQPQEAAPLRVSAERQQELEKMLMAAQTEPEYDRNALMDRWDAEPATEGQQRMGTRGTVQAVEGAFVVQSIRRGVNVCLTLAKGVKAPLAGSIVTIKDGQVVDVQVQERGGLSR